MVGNVYGYVVVVSDGVLFDCDGCVLLLVICVW